MDIISTKEMLTHMESGVIFSLRRVRYDRQRKKGGDIEFIAEAQLFTQADEKNREEIATGGGRPLTIAEQTFLQLEDAKKKDPNHHHNYSRNLVLLADGHPTSEIRKFHPPLVLEFNGKKVVP